MSMNYWGIQCYGLELHDIADLVDKGKVLNFLRLEANRSKEDIEKMERDNETIEDFIKDPNFGVLSFLELLADGEAHVSGCSTANAYPEEKIYFGFFPAYPWEYCREKIDYIISEKDVEKKLFNIIKPILIDGTDIQDISRHCSDISDYGCS